MTLEFARGNSDESAEITQHTRNGPSLDQQPNQ
jgi:hypothetical protein